MNYLEMQQMEKKIQEHLRRRRVIPSVESILTYLSLGPICQGLSPAPDSELIALVIARRQRAWPKTNLVDIPCIH